MKVCGDKNCRKCPAPPRCPKGPRCPRCYPKRDRRMTKYELDIRRTVK